MNRYSFNKTMTYGVLVLSAIMLGGCDERDVIHGHAAQS